MKRSEVDMQEERRGKEGKASVSVVSRVDLHLYFHHFFHLTETAGTLAFAFGFTLGGTTLGFGRSRSRSSRSSSRSRGGRRRSQRAGGATVFAGRSDIVDTNGIRWSAGYTVGSSARFGDVNESSGTFRAFECTRVAHKARKGWVGVEGMGWVRVG